MGWSSTAIGPVAARFVEACGPGTRVLDIGAGYGAASLAALERGAEVFVNDIEPRHLDEILAAAPAESRGRLHLTPGRFPGALGIAMPPLDAVLASNVLHFLNGRELRLGLRDIQDWLRPGGRLFVQAATPYQAPFAAFIPEFERRIQAGAEWPGWIAKLSEYCSHRQVGQMPRAIQLLDPLVLERECRAAGFVIERSELFTRHDLPHGLRMDGRETVGLEAAKTVRIE